LRPQARRPLRIGLLERLRARDLAIDCPVAEPGEIRAVPARLVGAAREYLDDGAGGLRDGRAPAGEEDLDVGLVLELRLVGESEARLVPQVVEYGDDVPARGRGDLGVARQPDRDPLAGGARGADEPPRAFQVGCGPRAVGSRPDRVRAV